MRYIIVCVVALLLAGLVPWGIVGCSAGPGAGSPAASPDPAIGERQVWDGSTGGVVGFYFLPPLRKNPSYSGVFDGSLVPVLKVEVVKWEDGRQVGPPIVTFTDTPSTASASEAIRVSNTEYIVNWHTDRFTLTEGGIYRIFVRRKADNAQYGYADAQVFPSGKQAKDPGGDTFGLVDGRTLPIKFRIETGTRPQLWWPDMLCNKNVVGVPSDGSVSVTTAGATVHLTGAVPDIRQGDVVFYTGATPFLRRVLSLSGGASDMGLTTEQATLEDLFQEAHVHLVQYLTADQVGARAMPRSKPLKASARDEVTGPPVTLTFEAALPDQDAERKLELNVRTEFVARFTWDLDIEWDWLQSRVKRVSATLTQSGQFELEVAAAADVEIPLVERELKQFTTYFAPIPCGPMVLVPQATPFIGASVSASGGLATKVAEEAEVTLGGECDYGVPKFICDYSAKEPVFTAPSPFVQAEGKVYAGLRAKVYIDGVLGPTMDNRVALRLTSKVDKSSYIGSWELALGLEGGMGLKAEILGWDLADFGKPDLLSYWLVLWEHQEPWRGAADVSISSAPGGGAR